MTSKSDFHRDQSVRAVVSFDADSETRILPGTVGIVLENNMGLLFVDSVLVDFGEIACECDPSWIEPV